MAMEVEESNELQFYPPHLWGLSLHFNTFNKLYVADILALKQYPGHAGAFAYGNHPMYKVDMVGVVVRKDDRRKLFLYSVDDGTGVVNCCCWKQRLGATGDQATRPDDAAQLSPELRSQLEALETQLESESPGYELGDLIHVRGKLKLFRDMMEIVAYYHRKVDNPTYQMTRMLELPTLYRRCYDKPFVLPDRLERELMGGSHTDKATSSHNSQSVILQQLTDCIQEFLLKEKMETFCHSDLLKDTRIAEWAKETDMVDDVTEVLERTLRSLEEKQGTVCCRQGRASPPYENLTRSSPLEGLVMSVLRKECCRPQYAERGCHYLRVRDEVRKTVQYSRLHQTAVLHVLNRLETNSDVIRVSDKYYLPL